MEDGTEHTVTNPSEFPSGKIAEIREPVVKATVLTPSDYVGPIMELCQGRRGVLDGMEYLSEDRVEMRYTLPLAEIVFDFFDQLKSRTKGYASLDYEPSGEQAADLVKVDILLQGQVVDAFSAIVHRDNAYSYGAEMTKKLRTRHGGSSRCRSRPRSVPGHRRENIRASQGRARRATAVTSAGSASCWRSRRKARSA